MEQVISPVKSIHKKPHSRTAIAATFDKTEWKPVTFGEVCRNINITEKVPLANGIERYIGLEHIEPNSLHIKSWGNVSEGTTFTKKFTAGQVLFGKRRAYLRKAAVADFGGICSGDILVFEANEDLILPNLFPFLVQSDRFFDFAIQTSAGSLSPRTKFQDLAKFEFLLPPKEQQIELAELLWAADSTIEKNEQLFNSLSIIKELFIENQIRYFKRATQSLPIEKVCSKVTDGEHLSPKFLLNGKPILSAKDILDNSISFVEAKYISDEAFEVSLKRCNPEYDDVLIVSRGATIGRTTVNKSNVPFALMGSVILLKPNIDVILGDYLAMVIKTSEFQNHLLSISGSSAQQAIYLVDIKRSIIPVPEISKQHEFVETASQYNNVLKGIMYNLNHIKTIYKILTNQIFS